MRYSRFQSHKLHGWRRAFVLCSGFSIALFAVTSCGDSGGGGGDDTKPPTVSSSSLMPGDGATDVAINSLISVGFSEAMDPSTITTDTFIVSTNPPVEGTVRYDAGTQTATFTPSRDLDIETTYTVTMTTGVKDQAGNPLAEDKVWTFTTGSEADTTAPAVISMSPGDNKLDVMVNTQVIATFSEMMDPSTINTQTFFVEDEMGIPVDDAVSYMGVMATFTPSVDLEFDTTYIATLTTGVKDLAGNPLLQDKVWSFTTGMQVDTTAPTVNSTSPEDNDTNVMLSSTVSVTFSEDMDPTTIDSTTFTLSSNPPVDGAVSYDADTKTATFTPSSDLEFDTTYTATMTTAAADLAGNPLEADVIFTFTTTGLTASVSIIQGAFNKCEGAYSPNPLIVSAGTTVTWTNNDSTVHTVTHSDGLGCTPGNALTPAEREFDSGFLGLGGTFEHTFNTTGTFDYVCTIGAHTMRGTVIVQ